MCCLVQAIVEVKDLCQSGRYLPLGSSEGSHKGFGHAEHIGTSFFCVFAIEEIDFCAQRRRLQPIILRYRSDSWATLANEMLAKSPAGASACGRFGAFHSPSTTI
jgi:hypothetical protein